jgi:hypothetical protein
MFRGVRVRQEVFDSSANEEEAAMSQEALILVDDYIAQRHGARVAS